MDDDSCSIEEVGSRAGTNIDSCLKKASHTMTDMSPCVCVSLLAKVGTYQAISEGVESDLHDAYANSGRYTIFRDA